MNIRADLGARPDRCPGVDHRPRADPGTDVDVARHQHAPLGQERPVARHARRYDAYPAVGVVGLDGDLVEEVQSSNVHRLDLADAEVEKDRLLDPLVHLPAVRTRLGDANRTGIEHSNRLLDCRCVEVAGLPECIDLGSEFHRF